MSDPGPHAKAEEVIRAIAMELLLTAYHRADEGEEHRRIAKDAYEMAEAFFLEGTERMELAVALDQKEASSASEAAPAGKK